MDQETLKLAIDAKITQNTFLEIKNPRDYFSLQRSIDNLKKTPLLFPKKEVYEAVFSLIDKQSLGGLNIKIVPSGKDNKLVLRLTTSKGEADINYIILSKQFVPVQQD